MARGDKGSFFDGIHGRVNDIIVVKMRNGKPVMCCYPKGKKILWTQNQGKHRHSFKIAVRYAVRAIKDPERHAFYLSRLHDGLNAYNLAISDFMNKPVISAVDIRKARSRDAYLVRVHAKDEFMVTRVQLMLSGLDGKGRSAEATRYRKTDIWTYRIDGEQLSQIHTIRALAYDYPGHFAEMDYTINPEEALKQLPHS
jgi:hypothetical protein